MLPWDLSANIVTCWALCCKYFQFCEAFVKSLLQLKMVGTRHGAALPQLHEGTWDACDRTHMHTYVEPLCFGIVLEAAH